MRIHAIIRAKMYETSKNDYFCCFDSYDVTGTVQTLYEAKWYEAEVCLIKNRDKKLEEAIYNAVTGSANEWNLLREYYEKQSE